MTLKEYDRRWEVESTVPGTQAWRAPLGDLILACLEHSRAPWWKRRGYEWKAVERRFRAVLNGCLVEHCAFTERSLGPLRNRLIWSVDPSAKTAYREAAPGPNP